MNEKAFQESLDVFLPFAKEGSYGPDERDYKQNIITALGRALTEAALASPDALSSLREVFDEYTYTINNLTNYRPADDFKKYLALVSVKRIRSLLQDLLYGGDDLAVRINRFKREIEVDYEKHLDERKLMPLNLISLFLASRFPQRYIIYRWEPIQHAAKLWGVAPPRGDAGTKYVAHLDFIKPIQERLAKALGRPASLVDVHSFLWVIYPDSGFGITWGLKMQTQKRRSHSKTFQMLQALTSKPTTRNIIVYGPPGTGKTYLVRQFAENFVGIEKEFITFHQSFAYEEFVEGLKPLTADDGQVRYQVVDGVFKRICQRAQADPGNKYLLIIDEINRANIARVFGELITLVEDDKRMVWQDGEWQSGIRVRLPYTHTINPDAPAFGIPENLYVLGTMNTADRSIALLDLALRRRFTFVELMPDPSLLATVEDVDLQALLKKLNQRITALLDRDHQIGHSYLMDLEGIEDLRFAWYHRVVPLLQEYFYNDGERLRAIVGKVFVTEQKPGAGLFEAAPESFDADVPHFEINRFEGDDAGFLGALRKLTE